MYTSRMEGTFSALKGRGLALDYFLLLSVSQWPITSRLVVFRFPNQLNTINNDR